MGDPIIPFPDLEDGKYYCVTVDRWVFGGDPEGCTGGYQGQDQCCQLGGFIKGWVQGFGQCNWMDPMCTPVPLRSESIVSLVGPYDTIGECMDVC